MSPGQPRRFGPVSADAAVSVDTAPERSPGGKSGSWKDASMTKDLIVSSTPQEVRVALLEDGVVSELFIEREAHRGIVGNIYKGRVTRVLPGMQSAFVDLAQERDAFLYVADVFDELDENFLTPEELGNGGGGQSHAPIEERLREGQDVLVQVVKEPLGTKGARITSHVSLPGRYLVFMPTVEHVGVSRKIGTAEERARLRRVLLELKGTISRGLVVRTAAGGCTDEDLRQDIDYLVKLWHDIRVRSE